MLPMAAGGMGLHTFTAASKAAAEHGAAANAAAAANERRALGVRTPSKKPDLPKGSGDGAGLVDGENFPGGCCLEWGHGPSCLHRIVFFCSAVFCKGLRRGKDFGPGCWLLLGSAMGPRCAS